MNYDWLPFAAFVISLISLFLTLLKYFLDWKQRRLKINMTLHDSYQYPGVDKNILEISFTNKTMHSVAITNLTFFLKSQNAWLETERKSQLIYRDTGTEEKFYSSGFPINIGPYESQRVYIVVNALFAMWVHDLKMNVTTNKGQKKINITKNTVKYKKFEELS